MSGGGGAAAGADAGARGVERPFRLLPRVTATNAHFWQGGRDGELRFLRCDDCGFLIHPPQPICPRCLSKSLAPHAVSGRGEVVAFTINEHAWNPTMPPRYVIAMVGLDEQEGLRLVTNVVGCEPDDVHIGMRVEVEFDQYDEVWLPMFRPLRAVDAPASER